MAWNWMNDVERRFDDLRRELLGSTEAPALQAPALTAPGVRGALADVADEGNEFVVTAELPGVKKDDIQLDVEGNVLRLRAHAETKGEEEGKRWVRRERSAVSYQRQIALPDEVSPEQCSAKFEDGVLTVRLPKVEPSRRSAQRIDVS